MVKNLNKTFKNVDGTEIVDPQTKDVIKLSVICINALLTPREDDNKLSGVDKVKRWKLAQEIYSKPEEIDLSAEDVTLLKDLIAKSYGTVVTAQAWEMLEEK